MSRVISFLTEEVLAPQQVLFSVELVVLAYKLKPVSLAVLRNVKGKVKVKQSHYRSGQAQKF